MVTLTLVSIIGIMVVVSANHTTTNNTSNMQCTTFTPPGDRYHHLPYPAFTRQLAEQVVEEEHEVVKEEQQVVEVEHQVVEIQLGHLLPPAHEWRLDLPFYRSGNLMGWVGFSVDPDLKVLDWVGFLCVGEQPVLGPASWHTASTHMTSLRHLTLQIWPSRYVVWEVVGIKSNLVAEYNCSKPFLSFPPDAVKILCYGNCGQLRQCGEAPTTTEMTPQTTEAPPTSTTPPPTKDKAAVVGVMVVMAALAEW